MVRTLTVVLAIALTAAVAQADPSGNAAHGATVFQRCAMCHNANQGGGNGLGPNLFGVVGRKAASLPGFYYSPALKNSNIVWTEDKLRQWVQGPAKMVPGTRMVFAGVRPQEADDLVAYLKSRK